MQSGQRVGPFDIEKKIGSGAMGAVYRARYRKTGQRVAIKVMAPGSGGNDTALARFEREAEVLKQLNHPNIVRFYVASHFQGAPYYAMEYIEGEPLDQFLQRRGRMTWEEVVEIGRQICSALQHAHEQGIIHRDLKPSNLMVLPDGTLKLTDFGIAKDLDVTQLTSAHCTVGTAAYMSPEQCRGERNLTHKSDLYSFGVLLYELLTGQKPFKAETTMDMFLQHVNGTFERPSRMVLDIPVWLDTLVCQLLEKKPEQRPYDATVAAEALNRVAEKVQAQQSAGVDKARARIVDRTTRDHKLDETDKQAARTILSGMRKGRRKRPRRPFYEKVWFQALAISALLFTVGWILYTVFRAPPAEQLFHQARKGMESSNPDERAEARKGFVQEYLRYYGGRTDPQTLQVYKWAEDFDVAQREKQLRNRKVIMEVDEPERIARAAISPEENGNLAGAQEHWQKLEKYKQDKDPDQRVWALLAEKHLKDIQMAEQQEPRMQNKVIEALNLGRDIKGDTETEQVALDALTYEQFFHDPLRARSQWIALRQKCEKSPDEYFWALLASKKTRDLKVEQPPGTDEGSERAKALGRFLQNVVGLAAQEPSRAQASLLAFVRLYDKDPEPQIAKLVAAARELLQQFPQAGKRETPSGSQELR